MECSNARALLLLHRSPGSADLDAPESAALSAHLERCPVCSSHAHDEKAFDDSLRRALNDVAVPGRLQQDVLRRIAKLPRPWSKTAWAAAAGLLLALAGSATYAFWPRTVVDVEEIIQFVDHRAARTPEDIEEWFASQGLTIELPRQLRYEKALDFQIVTLKGRQAGKVEFFHPGEPATVMYLFVLPIRSFRADQLIDRLQASNFTVEPLLTPDHPEYAFLLVYTAGGSRDPFLRIGA